MVFFLRFLRSFSSIEMKHQTRKNLFDHIFTRKMLVKKLYSATRRNFDSHLVLIELWLKAVFRVWYINNSHHLAWICPRTLSVPRRGKVFRERCSRKTVSYEEHIMSKDKYPSIFLPQMGAIVFIILQIFFAKRAIFKIGEYLTIILRASVGYEMIDSQRGA